MDVWEPDENDLERVREQTDKTIRVVGWIALVVLIVVLASIALGYHS